MLKSPGLERAGLQSRHKQTRINPALSAEGMLKVSVRLLLQPRPRPHRRTNLKGFSRHRNASPPDRRSRQHDGAPPQTHVRRRHPGCRRSLRPALCHDLFERNVWLLRQLALWLREDTRVSAPSRTSKISKVFRGGGPLTPCHNSVPHSSRLCLMR